MTSPPTGPHGGDGARLAASLGVEPGAILVGVGSEDALARLGEQAKPLSEEGPFLVAGYGEVGVWFFCDNNTWTDLTESLCDCDQLGYVGAVAVGCSGNGANGAPLPFQCLCRYPDPDSDFCQNGFSACDGNELTFCVDDYVHQTSCPIDCEVDPMDEHKSICGPNVQPP